MTTSTHAINKIKGTIYGQVIGDALGLGAEFMTKDEVRTNYLNGLSEYKHIIKDKLESVGKSGYGWMMNKVALS